MMLSSNKAIVAELGALAVAAAMTSGLFDGGPAPTPARAEAASASAGAVIPASPPIPRLCFHGSGGEILDFAPAGQHCSQ